MLNPDRFFDPEISVRQIARELYNGIRNLPIISPHGHVEARLFVENRPFPNPTEMIIIPDHYIFRLLYSQGISLENLGIKPMDGSWCESDGRRIWQKFGENYYLFAGTPTGIWLDHEFEEVLGVNDKLNGINAQKIYDQIQEKLLQPGFLPRALFERFNIEVLSTTDGAADDLKYHRQLRNSGWQAKIIPCFRPDDVINITDANWRQNIGRLGELTGMSIGSFSEFIIALEKRREEFKSLGAVSTDQGVESPWTHELSQTKADAIFQSALKGEATEESAHLFCAHMLMEMARMSIEDGLVMQIHPGALRDHNRLIYERFGKNMGGDIPLQTEFTRNLSELLNKFGNRRDFSLIVFTLDEATYSRELAPLAGHYPAMKIGPAWWFHDSIHGMSRHREAILETASIYNTVGFIDDTRAFPSIPARHDVARRVDSNYLAGLVARHIIDMETAKIMNRELAYNLSKRSYGL